jgi:hypothetical protein
MSLQDTSKIALGGTVGTFKKVENFPGNIEAGLACVQKSDGTVTKTLSDGALIGISLGGDLSNTGKRMAVCREGEGVPVQLGSAFTPTIGAQVQIHATSGQAVASGTAVNAFYTTAIKTGIKEDGTTCNVALIDMVGGL